MNAFGRLLSFLVFVCFSFGAVGLAWSSDHELDTLYSNSDQQRLTSFKTTKRIDFFARKFLNEKAPYVVNPLGEGADSEFEKGPLYRFDAFDCTTFVETVMALSFARTAGDFLPVLNQIRYKNGIVSYQTRNHFPSLDWIPNNIQNGFVRDITSAIDPNHFQTSRTWIEKDSWIKMKGVDYQPLSGLFNKQWASVNYITKEALLTQPQLLEKIPSGSIFHVVRPQWNLTAAIGTQLDISHVGFLIREEGLLYIIHASNGVRDGSSDYKGVKKELLLSYIERVMMKSPSMAGLNVLQILEY